VLASASRGRTGCAWGAAHLAPREAVGNPRCHGPERALASRLLGICGEVERMGLSTRGMEKLSPSDGAVFPPIQWTGTRGKTFKRPWFTKTGQEPNGMKLSSNTLLYQGFAGLSAWSWSPQARGG
jgi:hypothetical protein